MTFKDSIEYYRSVSRSHPVLTREAEAGLVKRFKAGDRVAKDLLVKHNFGLVIFMAMKHGSSGIPIEDLVQEGMMGLNRAIDKFDLAQNVKLSTYATWWINAFIIKYVKGNKTPIKMPNSKKPGSSKNGYFPSVVSLSTPIGENDDGELLDLLGDDALLADELYDRAEHNDQLNRSIGRMAYLGRIGQDIVRERLMTEEPMTLEELGKRHGLSRERIRQLEVGVKAQLRKKLMDFAA